MFLCLDLVIEAERKEDTEKVRKLIGELKKSVPRHIRHYDFYYSKLMGATIYYANMGPDTEISVVNETEGEYCAWAEDKIWISYLVSTKKLNC